MIMEFGIDKLRKVVNLLNQCNETFNQKFTVEELIKLADICFNSNYDFLPDQYTGRQLYEAIKYNRTPTWDSKENPTYDRILFLHIKDFLIENAIYFNGAQYEKGKVILTTQKYTNVIASANYIWGNNVAEFIANCFTLTQDSLHYSFTYTWVDLENKYNTLGEIYDS